ncbi:NADH-ubiquinone oxidoreductase 78 kDa subunit, mitochondrial precursor [Marssonina coronariae]|uniref:NADH-ubiquinone oxidoreductase 78 kDa subunit, mitochondrial n=1 Tax=Diplocarpon coronariae TaxID=2795749 RepID=A0A218YUW3_9HELO|nr:NADH-ubiquinone oxidoreductase 78 kDa subunit, mitochondrial precursor [Marssonina coronariae]
MESLDSRNNSRIFTKTVPIRNFYDSGPADGSLASPSILTVGMGGLSYIARKVSYRGNNTYKADNLIPQTIVLSVHGACREEGTPNSKGYYGVHFGERSSHNEFNKLPRFEKQSRQAAPLYAIKRAIEIVEDEQWTFKTLVIKTHLKYVVDSLSQDVWLWEENNYQNTEGFEVVNRFLIEKIHHMILEAHKERCLRIKLWFVSVGDNKDAILLANKALDKRLSIVESEPPDTPLERAVHYYMYEAPRDPDALELCLRVGIGLKRGYSRSFTGVNVPIRRLVVTGEDRPRNFERLFGPDWKAAVDAEWRIIRREILKPEQDVVGAMLDRGAPYYRPRLPTEEEKLALSHASILETQKVDLTMSISLADLLTLNNVRVSALSLRIGKSARRLMGISDGKQVSIEAGSALIQACEKAGVTVPRYCYHEKLMIAGNCRMCLVEVERAPKPVASCAWPVQPGMVVKTNSPLAHKAREGVMEFLLANHPLDCPICDQGGECDLQDQSMRYGTDRGRFHEIGGKRATEDKNIGPLIKTSMNRCIHCTRCIRFANDVAGAPELGSTGRGNDMQIGTYLEKNLDSEMSGNVIDLCPVGALTSKPYAFRARPWELKHTESVDVLDGLGSNIRVDSRGLEVMRILPRLNDDVNEEWINDKSRFACDGLKTQRLTIPLIRKDDKFLPASWEQALVEIGAAFKDFAPKGNEFKAIAGDLIEVESMVALKDLANKIGSENLALDQPSGSQPIAHGIDVRSNYLFNSKIWGVEEADAILIVGSNTRHEAAGLNARIRKQWMRSELEIGVVGESWESTFEFEHLGTDAAALKKALAGPFGKKLQAAKRPMIIVGSGVTDHADAKAIYETVGTFVEKNAANFLTEEWNGYNVLQRAASRAGAYEVGFTTPSPDVANTKPKFVWLLGADEFNPADIPKDAFVVYQGHHGDRGAQVADVILPGAAYTEKSGTYINTEGRVQITRAATSLPGAARTDWKIIRAASEFMGAALSFDDVAQLRERMVEISPALASYDIVEPVALKQLSKVQLVDQNKGSTPTGAPLRKVIEDFYFTDVISRSSPTMARCSAAKEQNNSETNFMASGYSSQHPHGQVAYGS